MSQILGASGEASEVDLVVVEALNNFMDGYYFTCYFIYLFVDSLAFSRTKEMEMGPWEVREDPELYTINSNGKILQRDKVEYLFSSLFLYLSPFSCLVRFREWL